MKTSEYKRAFCVLCSEWRERSTMKRGVCAHCRKSKTVNPPTMTFDELKKATEHVETTMVHDLKTHPVFFEAIRSGEKTFEIRKNDRNFKVGDFLRLVEWDGHWYTSRMLWVKVTYILDGKPWLPKGYVCMSIKKPERGI